VKHFLLLAITSLALCAQDSQGPNQSKPLTQSKFQSGSDPNDERFKIFSELEDKAATGSIDALKVVGEYYINGRFPVNKNTDMAKEMWTSGALLGSDVCASFISIFTFPMSNDTEVVIERTKWSIISSRLRRNRFGSQGREDIKPSTISESSFAEATRRAELFLLGVSPAPKETAPTQNPLPQTTTRITSQLRFGSLALFEDYRRKVQGDYAKASSPIYSKGDAANDEEKKAFVAAAGELAKLQAYVGIRRSISLNPKINAALREINQQKISDAYAVMRAAKIKTDLPATRAELNEATKYINALGQLMQMPVVLGGY